MTLVLIRHFEKPSDGSSNSLSQYGYKNALLLPEWVKSQAYLTLTNNKPLNQILSVMPHAYKKDNNKHARPMETVVPLSVYTGLKLKLAHASSELVEMCRDLGSDDGSMLISWHSGDIYKLMVKLGKEFEFSDEDLETLGGMDWDKEDFTSVIVIRKGGYKFHEKVLPRVEE